jgi:hypothetical protein
MSTPTFKPDRLAARIIEGVRFNYQPELLRQIVEELDECDEPSAADVLVQLGYCDADRKGFLALRLNWEQMAIFIESHQLMLNRDGVAEQNATMEELLATALAEWCEVQKNAVPEVVG